MQRRLSHFLGLPLSQTYLRRTGGICAPESARGRHSVQLDTSVVLGRPYGVLGAPRRLIAYPIRMAATTATSSPISQGQRLLPSLLAEPAAGYAALAALAAAVTEELALQSVTLVPGFVTCGARACPTSVPRVNVIGLSA